MIDNVVAIPDWATVLIASEYFATRRLLAFPVVNARGQIVGRGRRQLVHRRGDRPGAADLRRHLPADRRARHGAAVDAGTPSGIASRGCSCNIAGGLMAAFIASRFEHLLQEVVVLALFIPIVLALGESVSMQALSLTLQSFTDGPFVPKRLLSALWKEFRTAALLGMGCGAVVGARGDRVARRDRGRGGDLRGDRAVDDRGVPAWRGVSGGPPRCSRPIRESPPVPWCWPRPTWRRCCSTSVSAPASSAEGGRGRRAATRRR